MIRVTLKANQLLTLLVFAPAIHKNNPYFNFLERERGGGGGGGGGVGGGGGGGGRDSLKKEEPEIAIHSYRGRLIKRLI